MIIVITNLNRRKQVPMLYDGDLHQHDRILTWLTSQDVFEIKNEIEEVFFFLLLFLNYLANEPRTHLYGTVRTITRLTPKMHNLFQVNRKMLDKLLEENEFLAVYFCMTFLHQNFRRISRKNK